MSEEQLKAFLEKVKGDSSLQEKLKAASDADAALAIAKEAGFAITAEDIQSMQSATDLSDDDIEGLAGGLAPKAGASTKSMEARTNKGACCIPGDVRGT